MFTKKKNIILIFFLSLFLLFGCASKNAGHQIIGTWEHEGNVIEFTTDGFLKKGNEKYKFSVTDNKVTIDNHGKAMIVEYSINSNGTLTMNELIYYPVTK